MHDPVSGLESRTRFTAKIAAAYVLFAVISGGFVWYALHHDLAIAWVIGSVALLCILGAGFWFWTMRIYFRRYRALNRTFYSKLAAELLPSSTNAADETAAQHVSRPDNVTVVIGMYTVRETTALTLMSLYRKPQNALVFLLLSLLLLFSVLRIDWPPSIPRLLLALAVAVAFNALMAVSAIFGMRRTLKKAWQGKGETSFTLSSRGLEVSQAAQPGQLLPWASIDQVRETGSWILFMRGGRRIVALPKSRLSGQGLTRL
jgi:hypothetical protein